MIRRYVQHDRYDRPKRLDRLELKTRKLRDCPTIVAQRLDHRDQRFTDVAANLYLQSGVAQQLTDERRCRRLTVAARDGNDATFQIAIRELDFPDDFRAGSLGVANRNDRRRNAGTNNYE